MLQEVDRRMVHLQLGRDVRGVVEVTHRCGCGAPDVIITEPRLPDGAPFPTTYYLTCPVLSAAIGRLEGTGLMRELQELLQDSDLQSAYRAAHERYLADRRLVAQRAGSSVPNAIDSVSAGGMPDRVKCLHALVAQSLACGPGVNPIGDLVLERLGTWWQQVSCAARWMPAQEVPVAEGLPE